MPSVKPDAIVCVALFFAVGFWLTETTVIRALPLPDCAPFFCDVLVMPLLK